MGATNGAVALDTDAARRTGRALVAMGDAASDVEADARTRAAELAIDGASLWTRRALGRLAAEAWHVGTLLLLVADAADAADIALSPAAIAGLDAIAAGHVGRHGPFAALRDLLGPSPRLGDVGGTYDAEPRSPFVITGADPIGRGRSLLMRALADTADPDQVHDDEFELVQVGDDRFVVVLPGVTDLSRPDPGLNEVHRSVRDLDQVAYPSSHSSSVDDNAYAQMVVDGLRAAGVPRGAELLVVGHSFGADTALDLAADQRVNGAEFRITHVVAAGYHSQPQLADVPATTQVLVLQNRRDAVIMVEAVGQSAAARAVEALVDGAEAALAADVSTARERLVAAWHLSGEAAGQATDAVAGRADEAGELVTDAVAWRWDELGDDLDDLWMPDAGVDNIAPNVLVDVFDGGPAGLGHRPSTYIDRVATAHDDGVVAFVAGIADAGYAATGSAVAIDVSVPRATEGASR